MRQGWLAGRYPAAAAMVIFALVPYLGLSAALQPLAPDAQVCPWVIVELLG